MVAADGTAAAIPGPQNPAELPSKVAVAARDDAKAGRPGTMLGMKSHLRPRLALIAAAALIATACGSSTASPTPSASPTPTVPPASTATAGSSQPGTPGPSVRPTPNASADQAIYAQIETQVQQLRMLTAKSPVAPILLDEQGVRDWMTKATATGVDHVALAAESRLLVHMGLLPTGSSLEQLELDLNAGQAIGFYYPTTRQLYLLSTTGAVGPVERLTFSHEFTHALQDQNFGLDKLAIDTADQGDRDLARTALPEGDATLAMLQWAETNMSAVDLLAASLSAASDPQANQLANAPAILREDLDFPYLDGKTFVEGIYANGGWPAVDKLYANPPNSTSQVLHPDLYAKHVQPVTLTFATAAPAALGSGWKLALQDTLGELQLRVWLEGEHPTDAGKQAADAAASMWAGDRVGLWEGPAGAWAVVLRTQWRNATGRADFFTAVNKTLAGIASPSVVCGDSVHADIVIGSDEGTATAFASCKQGE